MKTFAAFLSLCIAGWAQGQHHPMGATGEKPVSLLPGLGIWTHSIATRNAQAQKFFDQGLVMLYGFNRPEALRSFRKALELDPRAAMAQWGVAMALGPYLNMDFDPAVHIPEACDASAAGLRTPGISETDRAWLEAASSRCPDFSDPSKYIAAMKSLAARFPDDPDAQTWYAESLMLRVRWHWYNAKGEPAEGEREAENVLEGVLRRFPDHPGANHLYIHAAESSPTPERAVPSAQRLMGIVPAAGHIVHMPGHIWLVLGEYDFAVDVNQRAVEVDREYFAKTGRTGAYYPYYLHNLQFIVYARAMQGRSEETRNALMQIRSAAAGMPQMAGMIEGFAKLMEMRIGAWDTLAAAPQPDADPMAQTMWHYSRALAFAAKGRAAEAQNERAEFEKLRATVDRKREWGNNPLGDVVDFASVALDARLEPSAAAAVPKWKRAVEMQDALAYDEPPAWFYPVRESLGAAMLLSGDADSAEAVFREGLRRSPKNGRMLFGLLESLKAQHKTEDAAWVQREFDGAWKRADITLRLKDL